jgi:hypothetical protein
LQSSKQSAVFNYQTKPCGVAIVKELELARPKGETEK